MSSDLLDAFSTSHSNHISKKDDHFAVSKPQDDEDDFGDFEHAANDASAFDDHVLGTDVLNSTLVSPPFRAISEFDSHTSAEQFASSENRTSQTYPGAFNRETEEGWGDFEGGQVLFDVEQEAQNAPQPVVSNHEPEAAAEPLTDFDADDAWDPVTPLPAPLAPVHPIITTARSVETSKSPTNQKATATAASDPGPPPVNLPPPSVFLAYITSMFEQLPSEFKTLNQPPGQVSAGGEAAHKNRAEQFQKHAASIRASGRVIAGRKFRWKRDTILSQSMKIGPAGSGGMKVSSLDKMEAVREDREIAEALHVWKRHVGGLRALVTKANAQNPGLNLLLPDITTSMTVRKALARDGALTARKCCIVCGLNRDERVTSLDASVEDSFGEWWVEHWGHFDCVVFWVTCKNNLPQR